MKEEAGKTNNVALEKEILKVSVSESKSQMCGIILDFILLFSFLARWE